MAQNGVSGRHAEELPASSDTVLGPGAVVGTPENGIPTDPNTSRLRNIL